MIVSLKDNVQRLLQQAEHSDRSSISTYLRLLDQRRDWIKGELTVEHLLTDPPKAPLGISENFYDLSTLSTESPDDRAKTYDRLIDQIDRTMAGLWERMLTSEEASE